VVEETSGVRGRSARASGRTALVTRIALAAAALAAAVGLFLVLSGGGDGEPQPAVAEAASAAATATPRRQASMPSPRPAPMVERIVVRNGKPVGGPARLRFGRGERVAFTIRSDVADEVHVHGFDLSKPVPANGSVAFAFTADLEGVFEIELEHARLEIAELRITP